MICQVVFHRLSSAEDDQNKKFQPKFFFLHFFQKIKKIFFLSIFDIFFQNCLLRHSSFEEVIRTCSNVKIANLVFIFSY